MKANARFIIVVLVGLALCFRAAIAQQPGAPDGRGGQGGQGQRRPKPPIVTALDANGDGVIDPSEIANATAALKALDKNGDGKLTADEVMPARPEGQHGPGGSDGAGAGGKRGPSGQGKHRPKSPLLAALDANGDGVIDASEIANAPAALKALDKNGDGRLTPDEYRPPRSEGQGGANGPSGGPEGSGKP